MGTYSWRLLLSDALAGITVALVALPLSVAIAIASGAEPKAGLVTAIIGGFLISLLGGSRVQIGGPTGAFIVVVYGVIQQHGFDGLLLATMMAGVILVVGGLLRAGRFIALVPEPVIEGFTIGIAVIIAVSQLKDLLGLSLEHSSADLVEVLPALWNARASLNPTALGIGIFSIAGIAAFRRLVPWFPGSLLIIAAASALVAVSPLAHRHDRVALRCASSRFADAFHSPRERGSDQRIAAIGLCNRLPGQRGIAALGDRRRPNDRRKPSLQCRASRAGAANIVAPLFGGLPATGAIARTATNVRAGGRTPVAGIIHALAILLFTVGAASLTGYLAMPALAGLLIVTAWIMSEPGTLARANGPADRRSNAPIPDHDPDHRQQLDRGHSCRNGTRLGAPARPSRCRASRMDAIGSIKTIGLGLR